MAKNKFTAKYEVDDGYVGGSRPQYFTVHADSVDPSMSDEALEELFYDLVDEEMRQQISACKLNIEDFVQWARSLPTDDAEE